MTDTDPAAPEALRGALAAPRRAGQALMAVFLGGFLVWGCTAPLAGGAVAPGVISPDGSRRTVQHLEGGIIAALHVRDGDRVAPGQPLVLLQGVQARTVYNALLHQHLTLLAMHARLQAEQAGAADFDAPPELRSGEAEAEARAILSAQRDLFATRRTAHEGRREVLHKRIEQSNEEISGLEAQAQAADDQLALIAEELIGKEALFGRGNARLTEVLALKRARAELQGRRGEHVSSIARSKLVIGETRMQILNLDADRLDRIAEQLDRVRVELAGVAERVQASRDVLARTVVGAPVSGTVVNLRFKTLEGVIRAGEAILDIVPDEEALLIDARVAPGDIDVVHAGQAAQVHLTAYSSRGLPRIDGTVRTVSADRLQDPHTGQAYYLARVEVPREALARLGAAVELVPGMPADVLVVRRERTLVGYLLEPLRGAWRRGLREV